MNNSNKAIRPFISEHTITNSNISNINNQQNTNNRNSINSQQNTNNRNSINSQQNTNNRYSINNVNFNFSTFQKQQKIKFLKNRIYHWLENPCRPIEIAYHIIVFFLVLSTIAIIFIESDIFDTRESYMSVVILEFIVLLIFTSELIARMWACTGQYTYKRLGRMKYFLKLHNIIDFIVIILSLLEIILIINYAIFEVNQIIVKGAILAIKTTRMLRFFRYDKFIGSISMLLNVIRHHKLEIVTALFASFTMMVTSSFVIFFIENFEYISKKSGSVPNFSSVGDAFYFTMVSYLTIGFGDFTPKTATGKAFMAIFSFLGVALAVLPSTIIGSGFAIDVEIKRKEKALEGQKRNAANLIQKAWRLKRLQNFYNGDMWINEFNKTILYAAQPPISLSNLQRDNILLHSDIFSPGVTSSEDDNHKLTLVKKYQLAYIFITKIKYHIASRNFRAINKNLYISDMFLTMERQRETLEAEFEQTKTLVNSSIQASCIGFNELKQKIEVISNQLEALIEIVNQQRPK